MDAPIDYQGWVTLWKVLLVIAMLLFGTMAIWVTIGGFFDIKKLLASLSTPTADNEDTSETEGD